MPPAGDEVVRVRACAKINLSLRVIGVRPDGYHELRTTFQSIALHDTLTFTSERPVPSTRERPVPTAGQGIQIDCTNPACPLDTTNLVWRAAERLWRESGRRALPRDLRVRLTKRIPMQAGLGGGSSDAAAALRALAGLWRVDQRKLPAIASELGADVPFFLEGGTVLGLDRGDVLFPLADEPVSWVVLVLPDFGVSTKDAYAWLDSSRARPLHDRELGNDLQPPVAARHPEISRAEKALQRAGAFHAAMSGSGSAVFGLFQKRTDAERAARDLRTRRRQTLLTRTLGRAKYCALSRPVSR